MAEHEFKVGDQVAHERRGNGEINKISGSDAEVRFPCGAVMSWVCDVPLSELRPRNFLSKIAEEQSEKERLVDQIYQNTIDKISAEKTFDQQFNEVFKDAAAHGTGTMKDGKHVPHNDISPALDVVADKFVWINDVLDRREQAINTDRYQRNAYGQLVDTVTGLPADSDGIVTITSIRDSVREIS